MSIKYIVDFDTQLNEEQKRSFSPAGAGKAGYIAESLATAVGEKVRIISPAGTEKKKGYVRGREYAIDESISVRLFSTFGATNKILKGIRYYLLLANMFFYLLFNVKKGEKILAYHTMKAARILYLIRKITKCYLILEVEEVYSDVRKYSAGKVKYEYKVIECADAYIFPTSLLEKKFNRDKKPYALVHGTYRVEKRITPRFDDGKIHCVYAGIFDRIKGGAETAIRTAEFLDSRYHVHIIGFGTEAEKEQIKRLIQETSERSKCTITYDGLKKDEEYIKFIQSCHIGLSTQNPGEIFNNTSFPSKVLSYMVNGLIVVSVDIPVLRVSDVNDFIFYYRENTPETVAETIKQISVADFIDNSGIKKLDAEFTRRLERMFKGDTEDV